MLTVLFLVLAVLCFLLAAFWTTPPPRLNLVALGLAFFAASFLIAGVVIVTK